VRQADRICVLEKGRVIELGSHDKLINCNGPYTRLCEAGLSSQAHG
jgi:ATP-binding cassette subfamily B protein/ATP-binding cassette subfamily C protein